MMDIVVKDDATFIKEIEGRKLMQLRVYGATVSCNSMGCKIA